MPTNNATNNYACSSFIVAPTIAEGANFTTIASALAAASSGDTIFIKPGTYTEDLTPVEGVNLTSFYGSQLGNTPQVIILGNCTFTTAGSVVISGIQLETNGDFLLSVTGSAASFIVLENCFLNCTNNTGITYTSSNAGAQILMFDCEADIATTGITFFVSTALNLIGGNYNSISNSGASTTPSTSSLGSIIFSWSSLEIPLSVTGTAFVSFRSVFIDTGNSTCITTAGNGETLIKSCDFSSGSAPCMTIGVATNVIITGQTALTTVVADGFALTGAGSVAFSPLAFRGSASGINVTSQTITPVSNIKISATNTGEEISCQVENTSNTASSDATFRLTTGGSTSGDPSVAYVVPGATDWTHGIDNSDQDRFILSASDALGTTNVMEAFVTGELLYPLQPAFLAFNSVTDANATGDGTIFTIDFNTQVYDVGSNYGVGVFTAPVTGKYSFGTSVVMDNVGTADVGSITIVTSNRSYSGLGLQDPGGTKDVNNNLTFAGDALADMDFADTASITCTLSGQAKTVGVFGTTAPTTFSWGKLDQ